MISVILPAWHEEYLNKTIESIVSNFEGDFEVIAVLDGYWQQIVGHPKVRVVHLGKNRGMRGAINAGVAVARGEYILKLDAHCMVEKGFDTFLLSAHEPNWIQIPRRKRLDATTWELVIDERPDIDYMYLDSENRGRKDEKKNADPELKSVLIDETESFQGSCYFVRKDYFLKLGLLDDVNFGGSGHESQEITTKCKRDGGRVMVNKNTWYAHWHKPKGTPTNYVDRDRSREYMKHL